MRNLFNYLDRVLPYIGLNNRVLFGLVATILAIFYTIELTKSVGIHACIMLSALVGGIGIFLTEMYDATHYRSEDVSGNKDKDERAD